MCGQRIVNSLKSVNQMDVIIICVDDVVKSSKVYHVNDEFPSFEFVLIQFIGPCD